MKVIIPLAGLGTRLRPHTYTKPKPLINVAGKPMLAHILDQLSLLDVEEYIFIVGYLGEQIEQYVSREYKFKARYVMQHEMLGQAHALWLCRDYVDQAVFMVFGDTFFKTDLSEITRSPTDSIAYVREIEDPRRFGVAIADQNNYVKKFVEKPSSIDDKLAVIGMYYFTDGPALMKACAELMDKRIQTKGEYFLTDAINLMLTAGAKFVTRTVDVWQDTGKPETVLQTNRYLLDHGYNTSEQAEYDTCVIVPPVNIHPSAKLEHSIIGPYATIGPECKITRSIIRNSIIDAGAQIEETMLDQSLIGKEAVVTSRFRRFNVGDSAVVGFSDANHDE
ncbi:MAG TPA: sugar phosphate nucleotidyltransferase [Anaerolineae bacterium]|nr:sugar phosphate nucleotidyltransferase [Anaerolineae bacterium]